MDKQLTQFIFKTGVLLFPLIILLGIYIYFDPFKVLRSYDSFYDRDKINYVSMNTGYIAVETFLRQYPQYKYDSFIFGSSRSELYSVAEWKKYITATEAFHFHSAGESLYGLYVKFKFFKKRGIPVRNALIIVDAALLSKEVNSDAWDMRQHPVLSGELDLFFQARFFNTFIRLPFLISYFDLKSTGKWQPYMVATLSENRFTYDTVTNQSDSGYYERLIEEQKDEYYYSRVANFSRKDDVQRHPHAVIEARHKKMLRYIKSELDRQGTRYRIVISPLFDQVKLDPRDLQALNEIFGQENVFDFSGVNDITASAYNYYDWSHYRPHVSKAILEEIYR